METKTVNQDHISTTLSSVVIKRREPNNPITETDLENYSTESVWRLFNCSRESLAKRLHIGELDVILIDAKLMGVKIDGYKVINPEGFTGREIEMLLFITLGTKHFNAVKFSERNNDTGSVSAFMLREKEGKKGAFYAEVGQTNTRLFSSTDSESKMRAEVGWGKKDILSEINNLFGSDDSVGELILQRLERGEVSESISDKANKSLIKEIKGFLLEVSKKYSTSDRVSTDTIFISPVNLPEVIYNRKFLFMGKRVKMIKADELSPEEFIESKGKIYKRFNEVIRQRIKWAMAVK